MQPAGDYGRSHLVIAAGADLFQVAAVMVDQGTLLERHVGKQWLGAEAQEVVFVWRAASCCMRALVLAQSRCRVHSQTTSPKPSMPANGASVRRTACQA